MGFQELEIGRMNATLKEPMDGMTASSHASNQSKGPISELQEYVQRDHFLPVSSHCPILKWEYDTRMVDKLTLEFRATVSFFLRGVPHHSTGGWGTSKKIAQRDTAKRALFMVKNQWNDFVGAAHSSSSCHPNASAVEKFSHFCAGLTGKDKVEWLQWRCVSTEGGCQATVEVCIFGDVLHVLQGAVCCDEQSAYEDISNRALWYFETPGHLNAFEPRHADSSNETLQLPPEDIWSREGLATGPALHQCQTQQHIAEQKTTLMRIQNQLQKRYGKDLPSGTPVWDWMYDYSQISQQSSTFTPAPLCRATVRIMRPGSCGAKEFQGQWCRGQKQAQLNACALVTEWLDEVVVGATI